MKRTGFVMRILESQIEMLEYMSEKSNSNYHLYYSCMNVVSGTTFLYIMCFLAKNKPSVNKTLLATFSLGCVKLE